ARPLAAAVTRSAVFTAWPPEVVKRLEAAVAPFAGAFAAALVRRSVAKTQDPAQLKGLLRRGVGAAAGDPGLIRDLRSILDPTATGAVRPTLAPEELERATQALAPFVGPIAKVLVRKAAAGATSFAELCARLGEHLGERERAQFLKITGAAG